MIHCWCILEPYLSCVISDRLTAMLVLRLCYCGLLDSPNFLSLSHFVQSMFSAFVVNKHILHIHQNKQLTAFAFYTDCNR